MVFFGKTVPVRVKEKNDFCKTKVTAPSHHMDRATVHGRVEEEDTKGSTWISKEARWTTRAQGICGPASAMWLVEKTLVVEDPCRGKTTVHTQWWNPGWTSRSRWFPRSETSWTREGDCNRRVHRREHLSLFYFPPAKCSSCNPSGCVTVCFQFSRHRRPMDHRWYYNVILYVPKP